MPRARETKNLKPAIKMLPGHVARVRIRCGKPNCKCARGERHTAFYHVTYCGGSRFRRYVRKAEVKEIRTACQSHRELQAELLAGRREHKRFMRLVKAMLRDLE